MDIYVDGKRAALSADMNFEYIVENRMFSGADAYTMSIDFPLKDCPENLSIFGKICRPNIDAEKLVFDCEIIDRNFVKSGSLTIVGITDVVVKGQFLEGRSEQNFDRSLDEIYINELDLGRYGSNLSETSPTDAWAGFMSGNEYIALPWVNNSTRHIQNCVKFDKNRHVFEWDNIRGLSWQPYLLTITRSICQAIGYSCDLTEWQNDEKFKYLVVCNALPYAWDIPVFARALPRWSVSEYFEKLELFMGCEFDIDHRSKTIKFAFTRDIVDSKPTILLDQIVDEYSSDVSAEGNTNCDYIGAKNIGYSSCNGDIWRYYCCEWFVKAYKDSEYCIKYDTMDQLISRNAHYNTWQGRGRNQNTDRLLYAADVDRYFIIRPVERYKVDGDSNYTYKCVLQQINEFGDRVVNGLDESNKLQIDFVPVQIDYLDENYGFCMVLDFSGWDEDEADDEAEDGKNPLDTVMIKTLKNGETAQKAEYYDKIYLGWWDSALPEPDMPPYPTVSDIFIQPDWSGYRLNHFSFSIKDQVSGLRKAFHKINTKEKKTFKFLSDYLPDVRAVYIIRGKRYVCEKITATFSVQGMSQQLKGEFYEILE